MQVKVLGAGCANCHALEERTSQALTQLGADGTVEMVTDYAQIAGYGVMNTPALVVDENVVLSGRVPEVPELISLLAGTLT
jgi:small redox-active disulfide protein 2